jgi:hypothetical protein
MTSLADMAQFLHKKYIKRYYPRPLIYYQGLIGLILSFFCSAAFAWGDLGHEVVMAIAWQHLTAHSKETIKSLLDKDSSTLTAKTPIAMATWADRYRSQKGPDGRDAYQHTHLWHFVDVNIDHPNLDKACFHFPNHPGFASDGPSHDCVTHKIKEFSDELKRFHGSTNPTEQQEAILAMKFLVHFVGDLHQPLHAGDHHDSGGNKVKIFFRNKQINLHHFWDTSVVLSFGSDANEIALMLNKEITPNNVVNWQKGTVVDWTKESFETAKQLIYEPLLVSHDRNFYNHQNNFIEAQRIAKIQLEEAGIRLAYLLNQDLN